MFGIFKSQKEKRDVFFKNLRAQTLVKEVKSQMNDTILSLTISEVKDGKFVEIKGEFGYDKSNPIPINGIDNYPAYFDKIRYKYASINDKTKFSYPPIVFQRTSEDDVSEIGSLKKDDDSIVVSSTRSPNIKGAIDVYNLFSSGNKKMAKIFVCCYSLNTSNQIPEKFFHRNDVPLLQDGKLLLAPIKSGKFS